MLSHAPVYSSSIFGLSARTWCPGTSTGLYWFSDQWPLLERFVGVQHEISWQAMLSLELGTYALRILDFCIILSC